jgi:hypothetical protein
MSSDVRFSRKTTPTRSLTTTCEQMSYSGIIDASLRGCRTTAPTLFLSRANSAAGTLQQRQHVTNLPVVPNGATAGTQQRLDTIGELLLSSVTPVALEVALAVQDEIHKRIDEATSNAAASLENWLTCSELLRFSNRSRNSVTTSGRELAPTGVAPMLGTPHNRLLYCSYFHALLNRVHVSVSDLLSRRSRGSGRSVSHAKADRRRRGRIRGACAEMRPLSPVP